MKELLEGKEIPAESERDEEETRDIGNKHNVTRIEIDAKMECAGWILGLEKKKEVLSEQTKIKMKVERREEW